MRAGVNEGYVCAQLRALASHLEVGSGSYSGGTTSWWVYEWVLLMNPDVFPTAEGLHKLHMRLLARPETSFFVYQVRSRAGRGG